MKLGEIGFRTSAKGQNRTIGAASKIVAAETRRGDKRKEGEGKVHTPPLYTMSIRAEGRMESSRSGVPNRKLRNRVEQEYKRNRAVRPRSRE